jgi:hypothetical protein
VWVSISELVEGTICTCRNSELLNWKSPFSVFAAEREERERERNFDLSKWGVFAAGASSSSS